MKKEYNDLVNIQIENRLDNKRVVIHGDGFKQLGCNFQLEPWAIKSFEISAMTKLIVHGTNI